MPTTADTVFVIMDIFVGVLKSSFLFNMTFCGVPNGPHRNPNAVTRMSGTRTGVL